MSRRLSRYVCNKSFIVGCLFAYVTVALFFITCGRGSTNNAQSVDLRNERSDALRALRTKTPMAAMCADTVSAQQEGLRDTDTVRANQTLAYEDNSHAPTSEQITERDQLPYYSVRPPYRCKGDNITREEKKSLDCQRRLPQVLGIGIEKCGTGALSFFLETHPNIAHSYPKELYYWNKHRAQNLEWYRTLMPVSSKYQLCMEYTPSYIFGRDIPYRIYRWFPDMRFIVMLREPVDRAVSFFLHMQHFERIWPGLREARPHDPLGVAHAFLNDTFESTVMTPDGRVFEDNAVIENALYEVHLRRWFEVFPKEQFFVIDEGVFRKDPVVVLQQVEEFLGVSRFFDKTQIYFDGSRGLFCRNSLTRQCMNKLKGRPHPTIRDEVREKLAAYFKPYNERLEELLERKMSWT